MTTTTEILDAYGHSLDWVRGELPKWTGHWPHAECVDSPETLARFKLDWCSRCWWCGLGWRDREVRSIQAHHVFGKYSKSDEDTCLIAVCELWDGRGCHERIESKHGWAIWLLWYHRPDVLDLKRLTELRHSFITGFEQPPDFYGRAA